MIPAIVGAIVKTTAVGGIGGRTTGGCGTAMTANGSTTATSDVVQRPILENFSGGPIKIVNPAKNGVTLSYMLNGNAFTMPPGYSQEFQEDRAWVIEFSPGANMDQTRYGLQSGVYKFASTDHGWDLYRSNVPANGSGKATDADADESVPAMNARDGAVDRDKSHEDTSSLALYRFPAR